MIDHSYIENMLIIIIFIAIISLIISIILNHYLLWKEYKLIEETFNKFNKIKSTKYEVKK